MEAWSLTFMASMLVSKIIAFRSRRRITAAGLLLRLQRFSPIFMTCRANGNLRVPNPAVILFATLQQQLPNCYIGQHQHRSRT